MEKKEIIEVIKALCEVIKVTSKTTPKGVNERQIKMNTIAWDKLEKLLKEL